MTDRQDRRHHHEPDVLAAIRELREHFDHRFNRLEKEIATMSSSLNAALDAAEARLTDLKAAVATDVAEIKDLLAKIAAGGPDTAAQIARVDALTSGLGDAVISLATVAPAA